MVSAPLQENNLFQLKFSCFQAPVPRHQGCPLPGPPVSRRRFGSSADLVTTKLWLKPNCLPVLMLVFSL